MAKMRVVRSEELLAGEAGPLVRRLRVEAHRFYQTSLISRYLGKFRLGGKAILDDDVRALQRNSLGMFFYNQRALVFSASALFLAVFLIAAVLLGVPPTTWLAMVVLFSTWVVGALITLLLHRSFQKTLSSWGNATERRYLPPTFDRYFLLDSLLLCLLFIIGKVALLPLDGFLFLLLANTIVYAAYVGSRYEHNSAVTVTLGGLFLLATAAGLLFFRNWFASRAWYDQVLIVAPFIGMATVTLFSIWMISWLRTIEHDVTHRHLALLGEFEHALSVPGQSGDPIAHRETGPHYDVNEYRKRMQEVLRRLCTLGPPFWYASACVWFVGDHKDRGNLLLPGPCYRLEVPYGERKGIPTSTGFLGTDRVLLVNSLKHQHSDHGFEIWRLNTDLDAPAAIVPLRRGEAAIGFLVIYGRLGGPSIHAHEEPFLSSFSEIVVNTMEQWHGRFHALSREAMDRLFAYESLSAAFEGAAGVLTEYLSAEGCMLIFRANPDEHDMKVVSYQGFRGIDGMEYEVGEGQTGKCAAIQKEVRFDDVTLHRSEFDEKHLRRLEKAHRKEIRSWLAIPIGEPPRRNYGVVKVVNSRFACDWFTDDDVSLGKDLALRLHVIIEHFRHLERLEQKTEEARRHAAAAEGSRKIAEDTAYQRQQDLMSITHQIQGGLIAVVNSLSRIARDHLTPTVRELVDYGHAFAEDGLAIGYGVTTALAGEAGQDTAFAPIPIDAPAELRKLAQRLQMTAAREDLKFSFWEEPGFPKLQMDRNVFTSVIFSLIHNVMKYADAGSLVRLECSFERRTDEAALKVKSVGEPIDHSEKDLIFQRFYRGRSVKRGRRHGGVGLGLWVARELMLASGGDLTVELSPEERRLSVFILHTQRETT
jgi:signal transduction histidine kinase